jgi:hypothetical protein
MGQKIQKNHQKILDFEFDRVGEFALSFKQEAYSQLSKIAILRKGRKIVKWVDFRVKDYRRVYILNNQLREFTLDKLPGMLENASRFLESLRVEGEPTGRYYYSGLETTPLLYASTYAVLLSDLLKMVEKITLDERHDWLDYINNYQCEDGLYRDPKVANDIAEVIDWWGWRHLSAHVVSAITALGGKTRFPFHFLKFLYGPGLADQWINALSWHENPVNVSNTILNYGVLLQYERDFRHNEGAGAALSEIFAFLDKNINSENGLWCWSKPGNSHELSEATQTSYHLWNLYFYDHRTIPYLLKGIDSCLETQNRLGGFGASYNSGACEDIDSIDPLCRFYTLTDYRHADIEVCLKKALSWVAVNQMQDGGFVFRRFAGFKYGHELMYTGPEQSNLFSTWFRMLSVAYITQVLDLSVPPFQLKVDIRCPGYQFWNE